MLAVLAVGLASPLVFFMFVWGGWAHPIALAFVAGFLWLWHRTREDRSLLQWALLGLLSGAIVLIRPTAGLVLCYPLLEWIVNAYRRLRGPRDEGATHDDGARAGRHALLLGPALATLCGLAAFSPQLSIWKAISGSWIAAPYLEVGDRHDWLHPDPPVPGRIRVHGGIHTLPYPLETALRVAAAMGFARSPRLLRGLLKR